jgi:hypothetical protein
MKSAIGIISNELFSVSLVTYLILLLIETLDKGFVSNVFSLNYLLAVVLISGIIKVLPVSEKNNLNQWEMIDLGLMKLLSQIRPSNMSENQFYLIIMIGLGGAGLVYFKVKELGQISILIAAVTCLIIFLLSYLIFTESENDLSD